ncbi:MAG: helix-turn-helix domain-containing protein, partial [Acidimicrobiales bacterium]
MSTSDAPAPSASALRLVIAAERLFAGRGFDGVSLRQIAAEAGSGNNSAVHYHFGSKPGLIAAIFRYRLPQIISDRRLLAARCDPDDLRSRFEAHFLPVLAMAEATDNHYVSFVEQIQRMDLAAAPDLLDLP